MAIHFKQEQLLTFNEAAKLLPRRRAGRKPHVSTLYRWASRGVRGVVLETIQIGGTTCTSEEALQRFFDRLQPNQVPCKSLRLQGDAVQRAEDFLHHSKFEREKDDDSN